MFNRFLNFNMIEHQYDVIVCKLDNNKELHKNYVLIWKGRCTEDRSHSGSC